MLQRLPINYWQIVYPLYGAKQIIKKLYNNVNNSIKS